MTFTRYSVLRPYRSMVNEVFSKRKSFLSLLPLFAALLAALCVGAPLAASQEDEVRSLVKAGKILPLDRITARVVSQVRGDFVGAEWDGVNWTYRLRFVENGNVINVDVDARTGQRVGKTKNY